MVFQMLIVMMKMIVMMMTMMLMIVIIISAVVVMVVVSVVVVVIAIALVKIKMTTIITARRDRDSGQLTCNGKLFDGDQEDVSCKLNSEPLLSCSDLPSLLAALTVVTSRPRTTNILSSGN